jgi:hypothetical protein
MSNSGRLRLWAPLLIASVVTAAAGLIEPAFARGNGCNGFNGNGCRINGFNGHNGGRINGFNGHNGCRINGFNGHNGCRINGFNGY